MSLRDPTFSSAVVEASFGPISYQIGFWPHSAVQGSAFDVIFHLFLGHNGYSHYEGPPLVQFFLISSLSFARRSTSVDTVDTDSRTAYRMCSSCCCHRSGLVISDKQPPWELHTVDLASDSGTVSRIMMLSVKFRSLGASADAPPLSCRFTFDMYFEITWQPSCLPFFDSLTP